MVMRVYQNYLTCLLPNLKKTTKGLSILLKGTFESSQCSGSHKRLEGLKVKNKHASRVTVVHEVHKVF